MSEHVEGLSRNQTLLFPEILQKYVNDDNPVEVCRFCEFYRTKCTKNRRGRTIWRLEHQGVVDDIKQRLRTHPEMMDKRKALVEYSFGTIKRAFGAGYLLLRGLRKVTGEVGLLMIAYNLRRVLNILGPTALIQALVKFKKIKRVKWSYR